MPLPASSTISNFDGDNKVNGPIPPAIQATDWDNPSLGRATSDVAGLGQCAPRFTARLTLASTTGGLSLVQWRAVWQNVTTTTPILARTGTGVFTITLPTFVSDEYDFSLGTANNIAVNFFAGDGNIEGSTAGMIQVSASGNVVTIHTFNSSGSANDLAGVTIFVKAYQGN